MDKDMYVRWDDVLKIPEFKREKPHRSVTELIAIFEAKKIEKILDLGCGTGRHVIYLTERGFELYGIDFSKYALQESRERLKRAGVTAELQRSDIAAIPYRDSSFDAVISVWVIYHGTLQMMQNVIGEIYRVMREGGLAFLTFQSKRSYKYGLGKEIEKDTFILEDGPEKGIPHHFSDLKEIEELMKNFLIISIKLDEFFGKNGKLNSHWEVLAEKICV